MQPRESWALRLVRTVARLRKLGHEHRCASQHHRVGRGESHCLRRRQLPLGNKYLGLSWLPAGPRDDLENAHTVSDDHYDPSAEPEGIGHLGL
jgi:hypothetical protein